MDRSEMLVIIDNNNFILDVWKENLEDIVCFVNLIIFWIGEFINCKD